MTTFKVRAKHNTLSRSLNIVYTANRDHVPSYKRPREIIPFLKMASVQYIHMFLFIFALIACLEIQISEGRHLKVVNEHEVSFVKIETELQNHAAKDINFDQSPQNHKDDQPITRSPSTVPAKSQEVTSLEASHSNDFRPTTPGSSPGIGHSFTGQKDDMPRKVFSTGNPDDFRPTGPGHSPGIGHSMSTVNTEPKA